VGTKSGEILIYDIASSSLVETIKAHTGTVWSVHIRADGEAMVSGSADKDVKFWQFENKDDNGVSELMANLMIANDDSRHEMGRHFPLFIYAL
jgi:U3 small nucleolar RNA-associated protein 12